MASGLFVPTKLRSNKWYDSVFRNRIDKSGEGVGFYIKNQLHTKRDTNFQKDTIIWRYYLLRLMEETKNTPSLIYVAYHPSSNETEKLEWLENFENLLADVYLTWKGVFIVTVDFNIDLLGELKESPQRYKR